MESGKPITKLTPLTNSSNKSNNAPSNSVVKGLFDGFKKATGQQTKNSAHDSALGKQLDPMTVENNRLIRRISNNTDTIVELLRKQVDGKKDGGLDLSKLLGLGGLAGLAGLASLGAIAPELAKATSLLLKVGSVLEGLTKGAKTAIDLAKVAKETASVAKGGQGALKTAQTAKAIYEATKNAKPAQTPEEKAKAQQKANGKWGNALGVGMIGSRAYSGDYTGAGMETASTVLGNVGGKYAVPAKAVKAMLDVGIVGRDVYRWKSGTSVEDEKNSGVKDWVKGLFGDKKEEPKTEEKKDDTIQNTNSNNSGGEFSNNVNSTITSNSNNVTNNYYGGVGGAGGAGDQGGGAGQQIPQTQPQTQSNGIGAGGIGVLGAGALGALALARYKGVSLGGIAKGAKNLVSPTIAKPVASTPKFSPVTSTAPKLASPKALTQGVQGASKAGAKGTGMALAKGGAKMAGKAIPFLGLGLGAMGAYDRAKKGDWTGAGLEMASGVASFVPVVGTGVALGIQGGLIARDISNANGGNETSTGTGLATGAMVGGTALALASRGRIKAGALGGTGATTARTATEATGVVADSAKIVSTNVARQSNTATNVMTNQAKNLKGYMSKSYNSMTKASGEFFNNLAKNPQFIRNAGLIMAGVGGVALAGLKLGGVGQSTGAQLGTEIGSQGKVTRLKQSHTYDNLMKDIYSKNGYDQRMQAVLKSQVGAESGFDINAKSHVGAFGLTQFMPKTAQAYGVKQGDAKSQLEGQAKYMKYLLKKFNGNTEYALMGYNWGEGNVDKWLKSGKTKPIPKETRDYVAKVMGNVHQYNPDFGVSGDGKTITGGVGGAQSRGAGTSAGTQAGSSAGTQAGGITGSGNKSLANAEYDLDKICAFAVSNAKFKSRQARAGDKKTDYRCAEYVRIALQKGDLKKQIKGGLGNASAWGTALTKVGWVRASGGLKKGDIAWFPTGMSGNGHVCIWTGSVWVSDWIQGTSPQPNMSKPLSYHIYRAKNGVSNGSAVGAEGSGSESDGVAGGSEGSEGTGEELSPDGAFSKLMTGLLNSDTVSAIVDYGKHGEINKGADRQKISSVISASNEGQGDLKSRGTNLNGEAIDPNKFMTTKAYRLQPNQSDYQSVIDKMATFDVRRLNPDVGDYNSVKDKMVDHTIKRYGAGAGYNDIIDKMTDNNTVTGSGANGKGKKSKWWERWFGDVNWQDVLQHVAGATLKIKNGQGTNIDDLSNNPLIMGGGFGGGRTAEQKAFDEMPIEFKSVFKPSGNVTNNSSVIGSNNVSYGDSIPSEVSSQLTAMNNEAPIRWQDDPLLGQDISKFPPDLQANFERARAMRDLNIQATNAVNRSTISPVATNKQVSTTSPVNSSESIGGAEAQLQALARGDLSGIQTKPTMMGGLMEAVQGYANGGIGGALTSVANSSGLGGILGEDMVGGLIDIASGDVSSDQMGSMASGIVGALGRGFSSADKVIKANPRSSKDGWGGFVNKSVGVLGQTLTGAEAIMDYKNNPEQAIMAGMSLGSSALGGIKGMFKKKPTDPTAPTVTAKQSEAVKAIENTSSKPSTDVIAPVKQETKLGSYYRADGVKMIESGDSRSYVDPITNEIIPLKNGEDAPDFTGKLSPDTQKAVDRLIKEQGGAKTGIAPTSIAKTATENLKPASPELSLKPDTFKDDVADKKVKLLNEADQASKNNVTANVTLPPTANAQGKPVPQSQGGSSSGLSAPMVVRNPDSIIREVSVGMMKASM